MTSITLAAVGKLRKSYWVNAEQEYRKRLTRYCNYRVVECKDETAVRKALADHFIIALDERGDLPSSPELADRISTLRMQGQKIGLAIGGADGWSSDFRAQASMLLAFGRITLPHQMARVVAAEQVYRAFRIINGEPYHKQ